MKLVLHLSKYNRQLVCGYLTLDGKRITEMMTRDEVLAHWRDNPDTPCECLYV